MVVIIIKYIVEHVYSTLKVVQLLQNVHSITGFNVFKDHKETQLISVVRENLKK